ncbi:hypothetical protein C8A03DRAFT_13060 [Achaetomium macrosporum]|uniref:Yippee/Mis18/Cereblon domain-containing protein n=1 Tax=Achaetomium macrosporum TaxID=79813 RepID=A0AAN7H8Z8_9PEZI|nr:hypothetical protein C8A03DRAFT_13060 [Achaetomium macrosporum]
METVFCECKKCGAPIGRFANLWTQIGKSFFSPVLEPEDDLAIQPQGTVRVGKRGALLEECHLQDIVCSKCAALLGLKCIQTPVNHVLDEDQILLRLASVELLNSDGHEIEFAIKRVLSVNEPSRVSNAQVPEPSQGAAGFTSPFPGAVELQQLRADLRNQREDIKRIDSNGFRIVVALDKRSGRIENELGKLKASLGELHRDVEGAKRDLGSIKCEISAVKASAQNPAVLAGLDDRLASATVTLGQLGQQFTALSATLQREMCEFKTELSRQHQDMHDLKSCIAGSVTAREHGEDMANVRAEMAMMRRQIDGVCSRSTERLEAVFPSRELEVLTSNIAKIGNKASQVETLKMELDILKGRVERGEASRQAGDDHRQTRNIDAGDFVDLLPGSRKRTASPNLDSLSKRPRSSVGHSNFPDPRDAALFRPANQPTTTNQLHASERGDASHIPISAQRARTLPGIRTPSTSCRVSASPGQP